VGPLPERYLAGVAAALADVLGPRLAGVYLHGSAVLGGFDPRRSDIDVIAVCAAPMTAAQQTAVAEALSERRLPCPAHGLEFSAVTLHSAAHPTAAPAFELHLTTAPEDAKVVDGHVSGPDPDLVLHFAVCRRAARLLGPGLPTAEVFAPVPGALVLAQLAAELRWAAGHAPGEYAVLNACRAWRFSVDGMLVSKLDGGEWARAHLTGPDRDLVDTALARQRCLPAPEPDPQEVRQFVARTLPHLSESPG
jgi:Domain of unknown function (DUF4111)